MDSESDRAGGIGAMGNIGLAGAWESVRNDNKRQRLYSVYYVPGPVQMLYICMYKLPLSP